MAFQKQNVSITDGTSVTKLTAGPSARNILNCSADHISSVCRELHRNGCSLGSTRSLTQVSTLVRALAHLGPRGLNTYEGSAAGYPRLTARIQDLECAGWLIASQRENLIGPDGLYHAGVARYVLIGRPEASKPQGELDWGTAS